MSTYQDFWYTSTDQLRLYAREYGANAHAPTLVCIPGLTRNSADFEDLCTLLADDYRILALDLRGRGQSAYDPNPRNYHPGVYAQDVVALLNVAAIGQAVLIGTSLGGLVSMTVAAMAPDRVQAIVLNDVGPQLNPEGLARIQSYLTDYTEVRNWSEAVARTRATQESAYPGLTDPAWEQFTRRLYREDETGKPVLNYDRDIAILFEERAEAEPPADMWETFSLLLGIPILALRGEFSDIIDAETLKRMAEMHPNLKSVQVKNRGHAPLLNEPDAVTAILDFLAFISKESQNSTA
ncbi:MAG: alpha/beta hydrolase [Gammaproteobacteria bacterium]